MVGRAIGAGASIEAIAREAGRDPSTVSYWARKHGLTSAHAPRHAARGGIERELLAEVVACELSVRDMAEVFDRSPTTIRHWLRRHRLSSGPTQRRAAVAAADAAGRRELQLRCQHHGMTRYVRRVDGFRCARCEAAHVVGVAPEDQARARRGGRRGAARCAATRASMPPCSSITSIPPRRASR